ncbi:MAG TPA: NifU family protein [Elusimicrobiota bacterium]|nr:NifU family protein [Elusimicrobiota bacterium]
MAITARLAANLLTCRLSSGKELSAKPFYFRSAKEAAGSALPEALFAVGGITAVKVSGDTVSITRETPEDWPSVTRPAAKVLEAHLASGKPAIKAGASSNMPTEAEIREKVSDVLEKEINPAVAGHGGSIDLVDVKGATVVLRMSGGCQGCASSTATLKQGVERALRDAIPELDDIVDSTDHSAGENPYYKG